MRSLLPLVRILALMTLTAIAAFAFTPANARVVITEVMWAGSDLSTADEWVELFGLEDTDVSGWSLMTLGSNGSEAVIVQFGSGRVIGSGQYLLISNYGANESRLSFDADIITTAVSLPNTKLRLRLYNASGVVVDQVDDGVGAPFAGENPSGTGAKRSMERIDVTASGALASNWITAITSIGFDADVLIFGTPKFPRFVSPSPSSSSSSSSASGFILDIPTGSGSSSSSESSSSVSSSSSSMMTGVVLLPSVFITEVLANPIGVDDHEWIEIANFGTGSENIAGWTLHDTSTSYLIPNQRTESGATASGFILEANEYLSLRKSVSGLSLTNTGEELSLMRGSTVIDHWSYPETAEQVSYGRNLEGNWQPFCVPTEGKPNELLDPNIGIEVQSHNGSQTGSGVIVGEGTLSVNLTATFASGSLASTTCHWQYSDGFLSESCNPPSHAFSSVGDHHVQLSAVTHCGTTVIQTKQFHVVEKPKKPSSGGAKSKNEPAIPTCQVLSYSGVRINEFLPDPYGDEEIGEWIELANNSGESVSLCGWQLDDGEEGSKPYRLDGEYVLPWEWILLPRKQTKISLNNDKDQVRLFSPGSNRENPYLADSVTYSKPPEGESYALRTDGAFVWTPFPSPEKANLFRTAERRYEGESLAVTAALPNPVGKDETAEWIEITNVGEVSKALDGWSLDNKAGGSQPFPLVSYLLSPMETIRLSVLTTGINLVNGEDVVRLLDPDGYVTSIFGWTEAVEGRIYRRPEVITERVQAKVVNVVDGDTFDVVLTDIDHLNRIPDPLKRRWLGIQGTSKSSIRVRMLGIDTPETVHPSKVIERFGFESSNLTKALLLNKKIELEFDSEIWDKYDRLLAYVYTENGLSVQSRLLRSGLAYAYLRFPFIRQEEYKALELEAKAARLGLWNDDEASKVIQMNQEEVTEEQLLDEFGLTVSVEPKPGIVGTGTLVNFVPSVKADLYLSINSGSYVAFTGSYLVNEDITLAVYAERNSSGSVLRSDTIIAAYTTLKSSYPDSLFISEVYPSPQSGEDEWIEIANTASGAVSLLGWLIDDAEGEGSAPVSLPNLVVPGFGFLVLSKEQFRIALNNGGDEVRLISPLSELKTDLKYGKTKKGQSAVSDLNGCITDVPTPGRANTCIAFLPEKNAPDADRDFLPDDREEYLYQTDPQNPDSDTDGLPDGFEVEQGTDPILKTEENRDIILKYKNYVESYMKPKYKVYVRKGLVLTGKPFPVKNVEAIIDKSFSVQANIQTDGSWEIIIPPPLPAGIHRVDLLVEDSLGQNLILNRALELELKEDYKVTKKAVSMKAKLPWKVKYRNELLASIFDIHIPVSHQNLTILSSNLTTAETTDRWVEASILGVVGLIGLLFALKRRN